MADSSDYDSDSSNDHDELPQDQIDDFHPPFLEENHGGQPGIMQFSSGYDSHFYGPNSQMFPRQSQQRQSDEFIPGNVAFGFQNDPHQQISHGYALGQQVDIGGNNSSGITIKTVQEWANSDNYVLLLYTVSINMETLTQMLRGNHKLPSEWIFYFLTVLKKITLADSQTSQIEYILTSVINSNFFESHMKFFFQHVQNHKKLCTQMFSILQNVFDIIDYTLKNFPNHPQKCYSSLQVVKELGQKMNILREGNSLTVRLNHLLRKAEENAPQFVQRARTREMRVKDIPRPDEEIPPEDFKELTIFPNLEELEASFEPFLRANKTEGAYRDVKHYTDVHFRLLREDYLSPIRNGIKDYKDALEQGKDRVQSQELRFYYNVQLVQMKSDERAGINFMVKFDNKELKDVNWDLTNRFMFGALLCFSKDNFETITFATVADRNAEEQERGNVRVAFESNFEEVFTSSENDIYVMAETVSFFESYRHVLEGLQEVEGLPLAAYIIKCRQKIRPPQYINEKTRFDFSPLMREANKTVSLLSKEDWPEADDTLLNESQLDAVNLAITKECAIIQGPPGTGKTYVGLKIMQLLLNNKEQMNYFQGPILVVCYTNHALDQFLEGILDFCPNGLVRVGGRSRSTRLECFNLNELARNPKINRKIKQSIEKKFHYSRTQLKKICERIRNLWDDSLKLDTTILSVSDLRKEISDTHLASLKDESRSDGDQSRLMSQWMKSSSANMDKFINNAAKRHLTQIIVSEGSSTEDTHLLRASGMVKPDFETRILIYRGWLQKYRAELQDRQKAALQQPIHQSEKMRLSFEIQQLIDETFTDILPDNKIENYMTNSEVFEYIRKNVEIDCWENYEGAFVKTWLLGHFRSTDEVLDAITRLARSTQKASGHSRMSQKQEREESHSPRGWVIEESDDSDSEESNMGFDIRDDDDDDDSDEDSSNEISADISEFRMLEEDFKMSEKKDVLLLQKAKLLGIDLSEEYEMPGDLKTPNTMTYSTVFRLIHTKEPYSDEEASEIDDVWSLSLPERYRLYKYWMLIKKSKIAQRIISLTKDYNYYLGLKQEALALKRIAILKGAQVIGMTTTGAARHRKVLKEVAPQIIVIEEAAEVLEAHIITTLNMNCKHLILIGDHQQLRPNPTVHRLAIDYNMEISLFERLVKNALPMVILEEQHRMRPEIADNLRLIYPNLIDHETVFNYDDVRGVSSNLFFLNHEVEERNIFDSTSKENIHEAAFLKGLCKYFLNQEYTGSQITILAAYGGQVNVLRESMENNDENGDLYEHVRISSIDNYQGEENDIILLSLVRSNNIGEVGFLKTKNRVCVALSRARRGLFVIGNMKLLAEKSSLWKQIVDMSKRRRVCGGSLRLTCVNHQDSISFIRDGEDFKNKVPEGGCHLPCRALLECGHTCPKICHAYDREHNEHVCRQACLKSCSQGHPCQRECYQECGDCQVLVEKRIPSCGHMDLVQCYIDADDATCRQPCGHRLSCGHSCNGFCGECLATANHSPCEEKVRKEWPCSHVNSVECHTDVKQYPCPAKCTATLNCGHRCKGSCGECLGGKVHKLCAHRCEEILPCGHQCKGKCGEICTPCQMRCPSACRHSACSKDYCGQLCDTCLEDCVLTCKHQPCFRKCSHECSKSPCKRKCPRLTKCQHTCVSYCGEECVCYNCEKDNFKLLNFSKRKNNRMVPLASKDRAMKFKVDETIIFMKIPTCGHIFTCTQLTQYVTEFDPDGTYYIPCPSCPMKIYGIIRYNSMIKSRTLRRENRKYDVLKSFKVPESEHAKLCESLQLTDLEKEDLNRNKIKAIKCGRIFASVLEAIENMHEHFNWTFEFKTTKWNNLILSIQTRVTAQFIEEITVEFHRLLIREEMSALKRMVDDYGHTLEEPLKSNWKKIKNQLQEKLTEKVRRSAEDLLRDLYKVVSSFRNDSKIEKDVKALSKVTQDVKDMMSTLLKV